MPSRLAPTRPNLRLTPPRAPWNFTSLDTNATTYGVATVVNSGASANTKNTTYTELIASTSANTYWVEIIGGSVGTAGTDTGILCDIAVGGVNSEVVVIPNLNFGHANTLGTALATNGGQRYAFPLFIPSGSRISATAQGVQTSDTVDVQIWCWGGPERPLWTGTSVTAYGVDTANSQGTSVTGGNAGEGTYTQITASTTSDHHFFSVGVAGLDGTITTNGQFALDLGIGPATETTIGTNFTFRANTSELLTVDRPMSVWRYVPSGTRLAARVYNNTGGDAWDVIVYGVS